MQNMYAKLSNVCGSSITLSGGDAGRWQLLHFLVTWDAAAESLSSVCCVRKSSLLNKSVVQTQPMTDAGGPPASNTFRSLQALLPASAAAQEVQQTRPAPRCRTFTTARQLEMAGAHREDGCPAELGREVGADDGEQHDDDVDHD